MAPKTKLLTFFLTPGLLLVSILYGQSSAKHIANPSLAKPDKFALITQFPAKRVQAYLQAKTIWDIGVTDDVNAASTAYEEFFIAAAEQIAAKYYPKGHFGKGGIRATLETRARATYDLAYRIYNVDGGPPGSMYSVTSHSSVLEDLPNVVRDMAREATRQTEFDFKKWEAEWQRAGEGK